MKDNLETFISICLIILAFAVLFLAKDIKWRGFIIVCLCALAIIVHIRDRLTEMVISYKEIRVKLQVIETQLHNISRAMETLVIAQEVTGLSGENAILLDYESIPQSIRIIIGPITHFPKPNYGYRLEGKKIYVTHPKTLEQINNRLPGGVTVEYLRKIEPIKAEQ